MTLGSGILNTATGWMAASSGYGTCRLESEAAIYSYKIAQIYLCSVSPQRYGPYWRSGDILGVCIDMDAGTIEYHRNGKALGEAFSDIGRGAGIALFPAFSLAYNDSVTANFGGSPFRHPVDGYAPLQLYPDAVLRNAELLLQHVVNLSRSISMYRQTRSPTLQPSASAVHMVLAGILFSELAKVISTNYVIEDKVFTFIRSICVLRSESDTNETIYPGSAKSTLGTFLTLCWAYMERNECRTFISKFVLFLSSMYREVSLFVGVSIT